MGLGRVVGDDRRVPRLARLVIAALCSLGLVVPAGAGPATAAPAPGPAWAVKAQRALNHLGCLSGYPDGRVDRQVRAAVIRFQSRTGRSQTGRLDAATRQRLYAEGAPRCDVRPVPAHSGKGRRIVVSQRQNWIWLVGPKGVVLAQGGMIDNPSVLSRGSYATGSYCGRSARIRLNQDYSGRLWLDDFVRFAPCGIGFHRIPRLKSNGHQIHADWLIGTDLDASHGCLRLSRGLADRVWRFTTHRTTVRVL